MINFIHEVNKSEFYNNKVTILVKKTTVDHFHQASSRYPSSNVSFCRFAFYRTLVAHHKIAHKQARKKDKGNKKENLQVTIHMLHKRNNSLYFSVFDSFF